MPNFVKIPISSSEKVSKQNLDFGRSVCMSAISFSVSITVVLTNEQSFGDERTYLIFRIDKSRIEGLIRIYTDRQLDMAKYSSYSIRSPVLKTRQT